MLKNVMLLIGGLFLILSTGCTAIQTFPISARAGDTVTLGVGYDVLMERRLMSRADTTVTIVKDDLTYSVTPTLRAVLQLFPDPNSKIANYSGIWLSLPSLAGDPFETVVAFDLPADIPTGIYNVTVSSPHLFTDFTSTLEVIPGTGGSNPFTDNGGFNRDLTDLERVPAVKVALDPGYIVGALSMVIDFDETVLSPSGINVQLPRYVLGQGKFQETERMLSWGDDGSTLTINILCPRGVSSDYLDFDILYPAGTPDPAMTILSQKVYDIDGNEIAGIGATLN